MKFEQSFFTSGENLISRYQEGLGVCASSSMDETFIDRCMTLGSRFVPEEGERTAEFVFYSEEFRQMVGAGISPGKSGTDKRRNFLCHFFIPSQGETQKQPEEYLIAYPFLSEIAPGGTVKAAELPRESYCGKDVLKRARLEEPSRLAYLLYLVYPCIFQERTRLCIFTDRRKQRPEEDGRAARELVWLLNQCVPSRQEDPEFYRRRLSFCVHSEKNISQALLVFTDKKLPKEQMYDPDRRVPEGEIPQVYQKMAEEAAASLLNGTPFTFVNELFALSEKRSWDYHDLPILYLKWKMKRGERVTDTELEPLRKKVLFLAKENLWYRDFFVEYLSQAGEIPGDQLEKYAGTLWAVIKKLPPADGTDREMLADTAAVFIKRLYDGKCADYYKYIRELYSFPETMHRQILTELYRNSDMIAQEAEKIRSPMFLSEFWDRYYVLKEEDGFLDGLIGIAGNLYEKGSGEDRRNISVVMRNAAGERWDAFIRGRIGACGTIFDFARFLTGELRKIEPEYAGEYAGKLRELSALAATEAEQDTIRSSYKKLEQFYKNALGKELQADFDRLFCDWEGIRAKEKMARCLKCGDVEMYFRELVQAASKHYIRDWRREIPEERAELYAEYRGIRQAYPDFAEKVKNWKDGTAAVPPEVIGKISDMKIFYMTADFEVTRENLEKASGLYDKVKRYFFDDPEEVRRLREQILAELEKLRGEYENEVKRFMEGREKRTREAKELAELYNRIYRSYGLGEKPLRLFNVRSCVSREWKDGGARAYGQKNGAPV